MATEIIKRNIHLARNIGTALDLGAGSGHNAALLAEIGFKVTAIDKSSTSIEAINNLSLPIDTQNIKIEDYVFNSNFDIILAINSLQFVSDPYTVIEKMKKHCDDLIFINVFSNKEKTNDDSMNFFDKDELVSAFKGWEIIVANEYYVTESHPPLGLHVHDCIELLVRKKQKNKITLPLSLYL